MGQEWAASTPFLYFTDHNPELGQKVAESRLKELRELYPDIPAADVPDPQSPQTFADSKLRWEEGQDERENSPHREILRLYQDLLLQRKSLLTPEMRQRRAFEAAAIDQQQALALCYKDQQFTSRLLVIVHLPDPDKPRELCLDLCAQTITAPPEGHTWAIVLETEDRKYGGRGDTRLTDGVTLTITGAGALLMQAVSNPGRRRS